MPTMTGRPGYRTMEVIGGSSAPYLARTPCVPLFRSSFIRVGNKERFRLPGAGGGSFPLYGGTFARSYSVSKGYQNFKGLHRKTPKVSEAGCPWAHSRDTFWTLWSRGPKGPGNTPSDTRPQTPPFSGTPSATLPQTTLFQGHPSGTLPGHFGPEGPERLLCQIGGGAT